jgi:hypothetical protein
MAKASPVPTHDRLKPDDRHRPEDRWKPSIQQDKEQPIAVCEFDPASHLSPKHDQLVSKRSVLRLKSACRLERRGQQIQEQV